MLFLSGASSWPGSGGRGRALLRKERRILTKYLKKGPESRLRERKACRGEGRALAGHTQGMEWAAGKGWQQRHARSVRVWMERERGSGLREEGSKEREERVGAWEPC